MPASHMAETALAAIDEALLLGQVELAAELATALRQADAEGPHAAEALLRLACCQLATSHVKRAHDGAKAAASEFRRLSRPEQEIDALVLRAHAATRLGRHLDAIETALLATQLSKGCATGLTTVRALACLGDAYGLALVPSQAARAFATAARLAANHGDAWLQLQVELRRRWVLAFNAADGRWTGEAAGARDSAGLSLPAAPPKPPLASVLMPGSSASLALEVELLNGLQAQARGDAEATQACLGRCVALQAAQPSAGWLLAAQTWLMAEQARLRGQLENATMFASQMTAWATQTGHVPLACIGHRLLGDLFVQQGQMHEALAELQRLLARERETLALQYTARRDAMLRIVDLRQHEQQLLSLSAQSSQYKQWAFEDALTGLPNLRRFTQELSQWDFEDTTQRRALCLALIDLDNFKSINDHHGGHAVGDKVLCTVAQVMRAQLRACDLPVRLGGDEFAILFRDTRIDDARQIAQRIQQSIAAHDWQGLAPGLRASVSTGLVEALPGDGKESLLKRADQDMYVRKSMRHRVEVEQAVPSAVIRRVTRWLRHARKVVLLVGAGADDDTGQGLPFRDPQLRDACLHVEGLKRDPARFHAFWRDWQRKHRHRKPAPALWNLVALSHALRQSVFITERVDGVLAMAGATNVIELYGNGFHHRCSACRRVNPNLVRGRCAHCNASQEQLRPDVVLLGEHPNDVLFAGAELAAKTADLVLVVDCGNSTLVTATLLERARSRGARTVVLGSGWHGRMAADVMITHDPASVLKVFGENLAAPELDDDGSSELSDAGLASVCFLTGQGTDSRGVTLEQALAWSDWELGSQTTIIPWLFPLASPSRSDPLSPVPTRNDFARMAEDPGVRDGMHKAFVRMLRFYGFAWNDGQVQRLPNWREGFANWVSEANAHDLYLSRILGALTLCGLRPQAEALLLELEHAVLEFRRGGSSRALHHWQLAVGLGAPTT
jgi:diguanylate cyclase (GGDEF)-like protein